MDKTKIWILASAIVMVGILALGWFVGVDPQLKAKASTDEQRISVEAQNTATELTIVKLKKDFETIDDLKTQLAGLRGSIPAEGQLPSFLTQLDTLAAASNSKVTSLTVSEAIPYTAPATSVAPVEEPVDSEGEAPDADAAAEPEAPDVPDTITDPRITPENFVAIPVEVQVEGDRDAARAFISELQHGPRLFMATNITIAPIEDKPGVFTATISGYVYVLLKE
ncbi:Tfp pilus assembly protein PilO [Mycetocola sp. CAN_C7]|uniref:hypothetical protein n=1 Tax=Mycetocola sp. CAN_C7 TaxID=2787724 RepID=UPI0018C9E692